MMAPDENSAKNQFYKSLERTGAEYFDYYLLHAFMEKNYKKYDTFHIWDFVTDGCPKNIQIPDIFNTMISCLETDRLQMHKIYTSL